MPYLCSGREYRADDQTLKEAHCPPGSARFMIHPVIANWPDCVSAAQASMSSNGFNGDLAARGFKIYQGLCQREKSLLKTHF